MTSIELSSFWNAFWLAMQDPSVHWQLGILLTCFCAGWLIARSLRGFFTEHGTQSRVMGLGVESFYPVLAPLCILLLLAGARWVLQQWQDVHLLKVAIPLVMSFALIRFAFYVLHRIFARGRVASSSLLTFERVFATLVWIGVALYITGVWPQMVEFLDSIMVPLGRHQASVWTILQAALSVLVTLMFALWAGAALEERLMRVENVHSSLRAITARMARAVLILVAVLLSLSLVGIDLTVLSVFGGALGVGIGLGLQKLVSSYVSGFVILIERSLAIGDMVAVDKYFGKVTRINTRYTILQGFDGIESVIPNDLLVSGAMQNYSLTDRALRLSTQLTVEYRTDIDALLPELISVVAEIPRVSKNPSPNALLVRFGADGFEIEIGFWIDDPENGRMNVVSEVNRAIWRLLQKRNIMIPYPQREIRILNDPQA